MTYGLAVSVVPMMLPEVVIVAVVAVAQVVDLRNLCALW